MTPTNIILSCVEGKLSSERFKNELYSNKELEHVLSENVRIARYIDNAGGLFLYLLSLDLDSPAGKLNLISSLSLFLEAKGITFVACKEAEKNFDLLLKIQPKWLNIPDDYLKKLVSCNKNVSGKELEKTLKLTIKEKFRYLKKPPKWLQSAHWPIEENEPLIFVDQVDVSKLSHDEAQLYIFYNEKTGAFITIKQSA